MIWLRHIRDHGLYPLLAILVVIGSIISCVPIQGDPENAIGGQGEAYQTALYEILTPAEADSAVIFQGEIVDIDPSCTREDHNCVITVLRDGVHVDVFYRCPGKQPDIDFSEFKRGDFVELRGSHVNLGGIDICGETSYYFRLLQ